MEKEQKNYYNMTAGKAHIKKNSSRRRKNEIH